MKSFIAIGLMCLLGIALGIGIAMTRVRMMPWDPALDQGWNEGAPNGRSPELVPKVVVDDSECNLGNVENAAAISHDFVFTNAGTAPLHLSLDVASSPRCSMDKLGEKPIPPGKSAKISIVWMPENKPGYFEETAKIQTNAPNRPQVELKITGQMAMPVQLSPGELVFSNASNVQASTAHAQMLCFLKDPLQVSGHELSNPETAKYFEVAIRPLKEEELKEHGAARSGVDIQVTLKPGLPPGPIRQTITFRTNVASPPALNIRGDVGSEIAVAGQGWDDDLNYLDFGLVSSRQGAKRRLMLIVRGGASPRHPFQGCGSRAQFAPREPGRNNRDQPEGRSNAFDGRDSARQPHVQSRRHGTGKTRQDHFGNHTPARTQTADQCTIRRRGIRLQ